MSWFLFSSCSQRDNGAGCRVAKLLSNPSSDPESGGREGHSLTFMRINRLGRVLRDWNPVDGWPNLGHTCDCVGPDPQASAPFNMKSRVSYRPARAGEMPSIRALLKLFPAQLAQKNLPGISSFLVATSEKKIVGCCALQIYSKRLAEVRSLVVHPDFQERRIASRLVELCKRRARARGVKELFAVTSETSFFARAGFSTFRREKIAMFFDVGK